MTFSLEVLFQMFIVTLFIWIWEWMQREKEEVSIDDDDGRLTKRNCSLRKTIARRCRCKYEKKLFTKELKCLIFFMTKIQQTSNSDSIGTEDGQTPDNGLVKDDHKNDPLAADISYTETSVGERLRLPPHVTDVKAEKSDGATNNLSQDTLQEICDVIISVEADETRNVDGNNQPKTITSAQEHCSEALNNPVKLTASSQQTAANVDKSCKPQGSLLTDNEIATGLLYQPKGPRHLVKWENFDDDKNDELKLDEGTGWDLNDMYATNAKKYNYKTTLDNDLSEYTTVLVREDTEEDRIRWERACRLADEIQKRRCPTDSRERAAKLEDIQTNRNQYRQKRRGRYQNYSNQRN